MVFKDVTSILTANVLQTKVPNNHRFLGIVQSTNNSPHDKGTLMNVHIIISPLQEQLMTRDTNSRQSRSFTLTASEFTSAL